MTIRESLKALNAYPIPDLIVVLYCTARQLAPEAEAYGEVLASAAYRLAVADIYLWLSTAPNISQGGASWTLSEADKAAFRVQAETIYQQCREPSKGVRFGYKGTRL